jgi:hypothetical protein
MKRNLTNPECAVYMMKLEEFSNKGNSIWGHKCYWNGSQIPVTYTVYSYGQHFPMYVYDYDTQRWYGNKDKYSRTTSKHQTLMRPPIVEGWYSTKELQTISTRGIVGAIERRLAA